MSSNRRVEPAVASAFVDRLMQDSYLLVVALRQGASAQNSTQLRDHCAQQVDRKSVVITARSRSRLFARRSRKRA